MTSRSSCSNGSRPIRPRASSSKRGSTSNSSSRSTACRRAVCSRAFSRTARPPTNGVFSTMTRAVSGIMSPRPAETPAVMLRRAVTLAQTDDEHLDDATLEAAAKIRVRLDARYRHDGVRLQGVLVPPYWLAPAVGADAHSGHVGLDRHAQSLLADTGLGEQRAL